VATTHQKIKDVFGRLFLWLQFRRNKGCRALWMRSYPHEATAHGIPKVSELFLEC